MTSKPLPIRKKKKIPKNELKQQNKIKRDSIYIKDIYNGIDGGMRVAV